jgi:hypothetical protein
LFRDRLSDTCLAGYCLPLCFRMFIPDLVQVGPPIGDVVHALVPVRSDVDALICVIPGVDGAATWLFAGMGSPAGRRRQRP